MLFYALTVAGVFGLLTLQRALDPPEKDSPWAPVAIGCFALGWMPLLAILLVVVGVLELMTLVEDWVGATAWAEARRKRRQEDFDREVQEAVAKARKERGDP